MTKESESDTGPPNRELYALLHLSPDATDEEIRKAYRQWAQVYHPDKYLDHLMKETATRNFQRICEAYEILSDETKRQIYDIYGMEGLTSGLELGTKLTKVEEIKEELERLRRKMEQEKMSAHVRSSGAILATLSLPQYLAGHGVMTGMAMASQFDSQLSKHSSVTIGGNLQVNEHTGGGVGTAVLKHQFSTASSIELIASAGLRSLVCLQTTRHISSNTSATIGLSKSLTDGSINLSNSWTRRLSETTGGNIQLLFGSESSIAVGWQTKGVRMSAAGEVKIATTSFGASAHYTRHFSSKSHRRVSGRFGSTALEIEVGGGRKISKFSSVRMMYHIGIEGIFWKFELHRGGQKLVIPVLLSSNLNAMFATGAFFIPASIYFLLKEFVVKPYYDKREKQKALENIEKTSAQVREAKAAADKAQKLLQNVANRKKNRQMETNGLVIYKALYGSSKCLKRGDGPGETVDQTSSQVIDVTLPLNFLVTDSGNLKLHEGVKKSGIMGFCDPSPGEPNQLYIEYGYSDHRYEVMVDDYAELVIPCEAHRI